MGRKTVRFPFPSDNVAIHAFQPVLGDSLVLQELDQAFSVTRNAPGKENIRIGSFLMGHKNEQKIEEPPCHFEK